MGSVDGLTLHVLLYSHPTLFFPQVVDRVLALSTTTSVPTTTKSVPTTTNRVPTTTLAEHTANGVVVVGNDGSECGRWGMPR